MSRSAREAAPATALTARCVVTDCRGIPKIDGVDHVAQLAAIRIVRMVRPQGPPCPVSF